MTFTAAQIAWFHLDRLPSEDADAPETWGCFIERPAVTLADGSTSASCACGCGQGVRPKSSFRQGHDQRLMGTLQFAGRHGLAVFWTIGGGLQVSGDPAQYGAVVLTEAGQAKLARYLAAVTEEPPAPRKVRVGRWLYEVLDRKGRAVHTDRGELGGLNWSSQHLS